MQDKALLVEDLAMLVRRLAHRLRAARPEDELAALAIAFLERHQLEGAPLLSDEQAAPDSVAPGTAG